MRAIVMAGGEGTRLRPLTCGRPKPMVELFGKSVLEHTVERLKRFGIEDICFTLRYLPEMIIDSFGDGGRLGVNITHRVEEEPLGTAGGVRACRDFIGDEDVLILSGDAVCDFDLRHILGFHREKGAEATLVLYDHPDPTSFGLVLTDPEGRVTAFSEKPSWERVVTDRINTGIYVLSPSAVDAIPENTQFDFGKDLFPKLLREGRRLYGVEGRGYWCDIGSGQAYLKCCIDILSGGVDIDIGQSNAEEARRLGAQVIEPVFISKDCRVRPGCVVGPNAVIGPGSEVGSGTRVTNSVINGAKTGEDCRIDGAVICRDAVVGDSVDITPGVVIGDGAVIGGSSVISQNVIIYPGKGIKPRTVLTKSVTDRVSETPIVFSDDRHIKADATSLLENAVSLGMSVGRSSRVGIAHTGGEGARLVADAITCGITAAGGECTVTDCDFEAQIASLSPVFDLERCVFVRDGDELTVTVLGPSGVPLEPGERRKLESAVKSGIQTAVGDVGPIVNITGAARAYISAVCADVRGLFTPTRPVPVAVAGKDPENRALKCVLAAMGHEVMPRRSGTASISVMTGGFGFTAVDERGRRIDEVRASLLAAEAAMRLGLGRLAVTPEQPDALSRLARKYGCAVLGCDTGEGKTLYARQRYLRDAVLAAVLVVAAMSRDNAQLAHLADSLPDFAVVERSVKVEGTRAAAMREMASAHSELAADITCGLVMSTPHGGVCIRPDARSNALVFRAEAENAEAAEELLGRFEL